jgi:hypothetical protein
MATTTWTQADVEALEAAILKGAVIQQMPLGGGLVTFRTLEEMRTLLAEIKRQVGQSAGTAPAFRVARFDRGYR